MLAGLLSVPDQLEYLWAYFQELGKTRQNYGWGSVSLTYSEIYAWQKLRRIELDPWELDTLISLDGIYLEVSAKAEERRRSNVS